MSEKIDPNKIQLGNYLLNEKNEVICVGPHWFTHTSLTGVIDRYKPIDLEDAMKLYDQNEFYSLTGGITDHLSLGMSFNKHSKTIYQNGWRIIKLQYFHDLQNAFALLTVDRFTLTRQQIKQLTQICQTSKQ